MTTSRNAASTSGCCAIHGATSSAFSNRTSQSYLPAVFGCYEAFLLVIAGVAAHFLAISLFALPTG
jgi:hypothetical protein